ncbi:MAG: type II toxin-antitoxin system HigA family antitoxin [Rhodothermia bacterium]
METLVDTDRATVRLIKSDKELYAALEEIDVLMDMGSQNRTQLQEDRYDLLGLVIQQYESQKYPRVEPDPVEMVEFFMDQNNLRQRDMVEYFGSPSRTSEVINYKRKLTLKMMRKLHEGLGIPLEILVKDYELENGVRNE